MKLSIDKSSMFQSEMMAKTHLNLRHVYKASEVILEKFLYGGMKAYPEIFKATTLYMCRRST